MSKMRQALLGLMKKRKREITRINQEIELRLKLKVIWSKVKSRMYKLPIAQLGSVTRLMAEAKKVFSS